MPDRDITCADCETVFSFTEREQEYYKERNLNQPKRCKACRDARKSSFNGAERGDSSLKQKYEITCDRCGKQDQVPFKPTAGRPVLCGECFSASKSQRGMNA